MHSCDWCTGIRAHRVGRASVFAAIRRTPSMPNTTLAERIHVSRQAVILWRREGEGRGCIPGRTGVAGPWAGRAHNPLASGPVYPIGTVWTGAETRREA